jgi:hypothetical protein
MNRRGNSSTESGRLDLVSKSHCRQCFRSNARDPTDAWLELATVTLTNTTQLYFDGAVIGQPARLYRLTTNP